jgi:hypothetical protein
MIERSLPLRISIPLIVVALLFAAPFAAADTGVAQAGGRFDGNWLTTIACSAYGAAKGYTWQFYSQVRNGQLQGQYGTPGRPASVTVTGQVQDSGLAMLSAQGHSGDPDYTVNHQAQGLPFSYHISAQFEGARGSGKRQEIRPCDVTFVRQ